MRRLLGILILAAATAAFFVPAAFAGGGTLIVNGNWRCIRAVDYDLVRVTSTGSGDGVQLSTGCTGRIGRLEVTGVRNGDGIKVQNASTNAAHDLVIGSGIVSCSGPSTNGTHQDGIQAMGGRNILFRNLVIDCYGGGGGNWFVNRGGGGATTPTNIRCEHCALGPRHPNQINGATSIGSGVHDSLICRPSSGRNPFAGVQVNTGNILVSANDPRCANVETLEAWITDTRPGPQPDPEPEPEPDPGCDAACVAAYEQEIADLRAELDAAGANEGILLAEIARLEGILAEIAELATV
jgi:hypothetical protein